jgi:hypothetical protein
LPPHPPQSALAVEMANDAAASSNAVSPRRRMEGLFILCVEVLFDSPSAGFATGDGLDKTLVGCKTFKKFPVRLTGGIGT